MNVGETAWPGSGFTQAGGQGGDSGFGAGVVGIAVIDQYVPGMVVPGGAVIDRFAAEIMFTNEAQDAGLGLTAQQLQGVMAGILAP